MDMVCDSGQSLNSPGGMHDADAGWLARLHPVRAISDNSNLGA